MDEGVLGTAATHCAKAPLLCSPPRGRPRPGLQVAPYDVLRADERLSDHDVEAARGAAAMWTLQHVYPILPWSMVVLESVPVDQATQPLVRGSATTADPAAVAAPRPGTPPQVAAALQWRTDGSSGSGSASLGSWDGYAAASAASPSATAPPAPAPTAGADLAAPAAGEAAHNPDMLSVAKELAAKIAAGQATWEDEALRLADGGGHSEVHPPLAEPGQEAHPSFLPTDAERTAALAWHGPPQVGGRRVGAC